MSHGDALAPVTTTPAVTTEPTSRGRRLLLWMTWLVVAHLVWGVARLPGKVILRRFEEVAAYRKDGPEKWFFARSEYSGADVIAWVRANTPEHSVLFWEGSRLGALEFAGALLAPRLLLPGSACSAEDKDYRGVPIATVERNGRRGRVFLVGTKKSLALEVR